MLYNSDIKKTAVIVAAGKGTRMGADINKVFLTIGGKEILYYTISAFEHNSSIDNIIIVTGGGDIDRCGEIAEKYSFHKVTSIIKGGDSRQQSVMNGLECTEEGTLVLIHDGARALVTDSEINNSINDCIKYGAAAAGIKPKDTLKNADHEGFITGTVDRENTYIIQTPQTFHRNSILDLHKRAYQDGFIATDDCMIAEHFGMKIKISAGSYENIKITTPEDLLVAEEILLRRI